MTPSATISKAVRPCGGPNWRGGHINQTWTDKTIPHMTFPGIELYISTRLSKLPRILLLAARKREGGLNRFCGSIGTTSIPPVCHGTNQSRSLLQARPLFLPRFRVDSCSPTPRCGGPTDCLWIFGKPGEREGGKIWTLFKYVGPRLCSLLKAMTLVCTATFHHLEGRRLRISHAE